MTDGELYAGLTTPVAGPPLKVRVALPTREPSEVLEVTMAELEANVNDKDVVKKQTWVGAEYVDLDSPYCTWQEVRRYGRSCRAFEQFQLRRF